MGSYGFVILRDGSRMGVLNPFLWKRITGLSIGFHVIEGGKCQRERQEKTIDQK